MIAGAVAAGAAGVATVGRMAWYKVSPKKKQAQAEAEATTDEAPAVEDAEADASS